MSCEGETIIDGVRISCSENEERGEVAFDRASSQVLVMLPLLHLEVKLDTKQSATLNEKVPF